MIFWNKKWAWWFSAIMFLLNNTVRREKSMHLLTRESYRF